MHETHIAALSPGPFPAFQRATLKSWEWAWRGYETHFKQPYFQDSGANSPFVGLALSPQFNYHGGVLITVLVVHLLATDCICDY